VQPFEEGLARVCEDGKYGFIDRNGEYVIPAIFEAASSFYENICAVKQGGKWGYIKNPLPTENQKMQAANAVGN
jgi:hypothetical protein